MKVKIIRKNGCASVIVDEKSYFAFGEGKLKGKVYNIPSIPKKK